MLISEDIPMSAIFLQLAYQHDPTMHTEQVLKAGKPEPISQHVLPTV